MNADIKMGQFQSIYNNSLVVCTGCPFENVTTHEQCVAGQCVSHSRQFFNRLLQFDPPHHLYRSHQFDAVAYFCHFFNLMKSNKTGR